MPEINQEPGSGSSAPATSLMDINEAGNPRPEKELIAGHDIYSDLA